MLWIILLLLTIGRLFLACTGCLNGTEAYLLLCGQHLNWGFVEGPAGVPALIRMSTWLAGSSPMGIRLSSPFLLLLASFMLWQLAIHLYGKRVAFWSVLAFNVLPLTNTAGLIMDGTIVVTTLWIVTLSWSWLLITHHKTGLLSWVVYGLLLGITTQVSYSVGWLLLVVLVIIYARQQKCDWLGVAVTFLLLMLSWVGPIGWNMDHDWLQWGQITWGSFWSYDLPPWKVLQLSPWFWQFLLLLLLSIPSIAPMLFSCKGEEFKKNLSFLVLLLVPFLFCVGGIGHDSPSFGLQLVLWAMLLPSIVDFFLKTEWRAKSGTRLFHTDSAAACEHLMDTVSASNCSSGSMKHTAVVAIHHLPCLHQDSWRLATNQYEICGLVLLSIAAIFSALQILEIAPVINNASLWSIPSYQGVRGLPKIAAEILRLRALEKETLHDLNVPSSTIFIIAETPELASLLGAFLPIHYSELEGAPSVFTPESPSFSSQFQLWPHYADAVASGVVDPLYTEETKTSPFLGHDAFYVTTESLEDLPETISGAFSSVLLVSEATLQRGNQSEHLHIYECKNYQMLPL